MYRTGGQWLDMVTTGHACDQTHCRLTYAADSKVLDITHHLALSRMSEARDPTSASLLSRVGGVDRVQWEVW